MLNRVVGLIDEARRASARTLNAIMTATYWLIGRHIVEFEQQGKAERITARTCWRGLRRI
jgi:hypothetical protein